MQEKHSYINMEASSAFKSYSGSADAKIEQDLLLAEIRKFLPAGEKARILDAACGTGWLSKRLFKEGYDMTACDISGNLISEFTSYLSEIRVDVCDLNVEIPYQKESFQCAIINMSCHDFRDLEKAISLMHDVLVPGGKLIITIANPYYSHPIGSWKRGIWRKIFGKKPLLRLFPYNFAKRSDREHVWKGKIPSYFYTLPEYFEAAFSAGFSLEHFGEICSENDSKSFNRKYQLFRFPMLLIFVFKK